MQSSLPQIGETEIPADCHNLPAGWRYVRLGDLLTQCQYGLSVAADNKTGTPMVGMKHLVGGRVILNDCPLISLSAQQLAAFLLTPGDLLFNRTNSLDLVGKTGLFMGQEDAVFASYLVRLRVRRDCSLPEFVNLCLNTPHYQMQVKKLATKGVSQCNINPTQLRKQVFLPLPTLAEQTRIVEILVAAEAAIRATESLLEAKIRYKRALAEQLLTGRIRFPEFKGQDWQQYRLGELFTERIEMNRPDLKLLSVTGIQGIVDRGSLAKRDTSNEDKSKYLRVARGDIAYNTMRMWQGVFGLSALEGIVSPAYTVCIPHARIEGSFAAYLFKLPATIALFHSHSQGIVDDTLNCKFPSFAKIKVTIPDVIEQRRIANVLGLMDEEIDLLRRELEALKQQKQGLMQKLLTGQVRVREFAV